MLDEGDDCSFLDPDDTDLSPGSGLLDLTRESDDMSLGADLLEDIYSVPSVFVEGYQVDDEIEDPSGTTWWGGMLVVLALVGIFVAIICVIVAHVSR